MGKTIRVIGMSDREDYFEKMSEIIKKTDEQHWNFFGEEPMKELSLELMRNGELSRIVQVDDVAAGYVDLKLLKKNAGLLLWNDLYKQAGLAMQDLTVNYAEINSETTLESDIYINVIAMDNSYRGSMAITKYILFGLYDMLNQLLSNKSSEDEERVVYAVAVTEQGNKMCKLLGMMKKTVSYRHYQGVENRRTLYKLPLSLFCDNLIALKSKLG